MRQLGAGFSFAGYHSEDLGVVLGNNDALMHAVTANFTTTVETVDGYKGAYPAGTKEGEKEFEIVMICEDMDDGQMAKLGWVFREGNEGELIFDHAPYKHYEARVTTGITPPTHGYYDRVRGVYVYSGTATVALTAFVPRAYMNDDVIADYPDVEQTSKATLEAATGIVLPTKRPDVILSDVSDETTLLLLNQGTARAACTITIEGQMQDGVTISNVTTGQTMTITAPDADTHTYSIDGTYGMVTEVVDGVAKRRDNVKTGRYIEIESCMPFYRNVGVVASGSTVTVDGAMPTLIHAGQYIYLNEWKKITAVGETTMTIDGTATFTGDTEIASMNEIHVTPNGSTTIDSIQFIYKDTFY